MRSTVTRPTHLNLNFPIDPDPPQFCWYGWIDPSPGGEFWRTHCSLVPEPYPFETQANDWGLEGLGNVYGIRRLMTRIQHQEVYSEEHTVFQQRLHNLLQHTQKVWV